MGALSKPATSSLGPRSTLPPSSRTRASPRPAQHHAFAYGWEGTRSVIQFAAEGRRIRFELQLPAREEPEFVRTQGRGPQRSPAEAEKAWEQACRQRWRALALVVTAKLEAVAAGISDFEEEFVAHVLLPDPGRLVVCRSPGCLEDAGDDRLRLCPGHRVAYEARRVQVLERADLIAMRMPGEPPRPPRRKGTTVRVL